MNYYVEEVYKLEHILTSNKLLRTILDAKLKTFIKLNKKNNCQHQHNNNAMDYLSFCKNEEFFMENLVLKKIDPVYFKLK